VSGVAAYFETRRRFGHGPSRIFSSSIWVDNLLLLALVKLDYTDEQDYVELNKKSKAFFGLAGAVPTLFSLAPLFQSQCQLFYICPFPGVYAQNLRPNFFT
jgi:hypothetical protein